MERDHEDQRKRLWIDVFVAVANASNSVNKESCARWADYALQEFDSRFRRV